jgi:S1-C subfamily serine protease
VPSTDVRTERELGTLRAEVTELRRKVEKPKKDAWDKMTAISGLVSGLAVALIGFYATNVYNRRQRQSDERRKDQELLIAQIQTVEKFIPYLSSTDENTKSGALISISALGNEELAIKLATAFGGPGATVALTSIASTAGPQGAASAERALGDIFQYLQACVVAISVEGKQLRGSGFIVAAHGLIATAFYVVDGIGSDRPVIHFNDRRQVPANVIKMDKKRGLALIVTESAESLDFLKLIPSKVGLGERVLALLMGEQGERRIEIGNVVGIRAGGESEDQKLLIFLNNVGRGSGGSVVVDTASNIIGMIYSKDASQPNIVSLVPAADIISLVDEATRETTVQKS